MAQAKGRPATASLAPPRWRSVLKAVRPHQWAKNVLVFVPLVMSHQLTNGPKLIAATACFAAFSLLASAVYVVNDLVDIKADRAHPTKRTRPFASGQLGVANGIAMALGSVCGAFALSIWALPRAAILMLVAYALLTTAYSLFLKRKLMLDVLTLAALYTHRMLSGGVATGIVVSEWLLAFSMFLFLSLALAKRYTELRGLPVGVEGRIQGRGYWAKDLDLIRTLGPTSGTIAVLVLVLYINLSPEVGRHYPAPWVLYFICPIVLYWITRIWFLAQRGQLDDDPVVFALKDRVSLLAGAVTVALLILASRNIPSWTLAEKEIPWTEPYQRETRRLQQHLALQAASTPTVRVAAQYGLSWSTVRRAENSAIARWEAQRPKVALRDVGVDKKKVGYTEECALDLTSLFLEEVP